MLEITPFRFQTPAVNHPQYARKTDAGICLTVKETETVEEERIRRESEKLRLEDLIIQLNFCSRMELLNFIATVVLVTASGALAPGPLFFATVSHGTRSGAKGGLAFSIGHTLVEFPLVLLLALVFGEVATEIAGEPIVRVSTGIAGGLFLLIFGAMQIRHFLTSKFETPDSSGITSRNPLLLGLVLTGLNPYFIVWWLAVGSKLVVDALAFASLLGVLLMYISHVWMDYAWLTAVAHLAHVGTKIAGTRWYRAAMTLFGAVLIYFGLAFLISVL